MSQDSSERITCRDWSPIPCDARRAARERGEIDYVWGLGWIWWRSKNVLEPWTRCPWCDGYLPTMTGVINHGLLHGWPDHE